MKQLILIIITYVVIRYASMFPHFFTTWLVSVYPPVEGVSAAFIWFGLTLWTFLMGIFAGYALSRL